MARERHLTRGVGSAMLQERGLLVNCVHQGWGGRPAEHVRRQCGVGARFTNFGQEPKEGQILPKATQCGAPGGAARAGGGGAGDCRGSDQHGWLAPRTAEQMDGLPHKLPDSQPQHSGLDTERGAFQPQKLLKPPTISGVMPCRSAVSRRTARLQPLPATNQTTIGHADAIHVLA